MSAEHWAILWDLAGVLVPELSHDPAGDGQRHGLEASVWQDLLYQGLEKERMWDLVETDQLSLDEFVDAFQMRINSAGGDADTEALRYFWFGGSYPSRTCSQAILNLIRSWLGGPLVGIATNNVREYRDLWWPSMPTGVFDVVFDSSEIGHRKPQPEFFNVIAAQLPVGIDRILLVDDRAANVTAARVAGWEATHFRCESSLLELPPEVRAWADT